MKRALSLQQVKKLVFKEKLFISLFLMCTMIPGLAFAQQGSGNVTGTVIDNYGDPLIGVTIAVKGTTTGDYSDFDGRFSVPAKDGDILVFSYIGFLTQEVKISDVTRGVNVTLLEDTQTLDEVVVVGYGTMQKKQVTSSITTISADKLPVGVGGPTIATALQGKVSGLVINDSSNPNGGIGLQLRGPASISAGQAPLVVIDGMPGGDLRSLIQEDILSIDILKDASAGAIYGTRAAGGVILVTTKGSQVDDGKVKMSYSGEVIFKQVFKKPNLMTADEFRYHNVGEDFGSSADWWNEALADNPTSQKHTLTLQTGTKNASLYTSFTWENNRGIMKFQDRTDYAGRVNAKFKLFEGWLDLSTRADFRSANRNRSGVGMSQIFWNNPTRSPYDPDSETGYNIWQGETNQRNAIADAALFTDEGVDKWFRPDVSAKLNILPIPGLSYQQTLAYELRQWEGHTFRSSQHLDEASKGRTGTASIEFDKTEHLNTEGYFTYLKTFGDHFINATAGYSFFEYNREKFNMENRDYTDDRVKYWDIGKGKDLALGAAKMSSRKYITERLMAYFGRVNYNYKDKYMATATFRREGSSKFAIENRWGNFWSISAGWRITGEEFMQPLTWINDLKLRGGYGVTGNNDFDAKYAATLYGSDKYWIMPDGEWAFTYGKTQNYNTELKWEEKAEWNIGLDYSLFNNRLYGKFDLYRRKVNDMIYEVQVSTPPYTREKMHKNIGSMENRGWEFEIGGDIVRTKDWHYSSSLNMSNNKSKIITLDGNQSVLWKGGFPSPGSYGNPIRLEEGSEIGSFYLYKYAGVNEDGKFLVYNTKGEAVTLDQKKDEDKQYVGNYTPKLILGWTHNVSYKNWDLGVTFTSWLNFDIYNTLEMYMGLPHSGEGFNLLSDAFKRNGHIHDKREIMDFFVEDASFFKIQNINLGYTHDLKKYTKFVEKARIYLTINNVATFSKYSGMNPEQNITGLEGGIEYFNEITPMTRNYTLGVQLNF